jgi:hypothetical protein
MDKEKGQKDKKQYNKQYVENQRSTNNNPT